MVFAPCHVTYVLAVDEEHAWRVAGEPEVLGGRKVVQKAFVQGGRLMVTMSKEAVKYAEEGIIGTAMLRKLHATPVMEAVRDPKPILSEGLKISPPFDAPIEDKGVMILGCGVTRDHIEEYRKMDPKAEVWTMNDERYEGATRHFQPHCVEPFKRFGKEFFDTSDLDIPVYTPHNYPYDKIRRVWLNTSIDYMLAIADVDGFSRVFLPGVDFGGKREQFEKLSAQYWMGVLEGKGATVFLSPLYTGFDCEVYGFAS
jgi:hypothetical protein